MNMWVGLKEIGQMIGTTPMGVKHIADKNNFPLEKKKSNEKIYKVGSVTASRILQFKDFPPPAEILAIENCKGGVGKTLVSHTLASLHSLLWGNLKTLIIDLDFQGNLTTSFKVSKKMGVHKTIYDVHAKGASIKECVVPITKNLDIIPANQLLSLLDNHMIVSQTLQHTFFERILRPIRNNYSLVIIDCPPRISASTTAANIYADTILFVTDLDEFAVDGIDTMFAHMMEISETYAGSGTEIKAQPKILINKYDGRERLSLKHKSRLTEKYEDFLLDSFICKASLVKNSISKRQFLWETPKASKFFSDTIDVYKEIFNLNKTLQ